MGLSQSNSFGWQETENIIYPEFYAALLFFDNPPYEIVFELCFFLTLLLRLPQENSCAEYRFDLRSTLLASCGWTD